LDLSLFLNWFDLFRSSYRPLFWPYAPRLRSLLPVEEQGTEATHLLLPLSLDIEFQCYLGPLHLHIKVSQIISSENVAQENSKTLTTTTSLKPVDIADFYPMFFVGLCMYYLFIMVYITMVLSVPSSAASRRRPSMEARV
jgi:hypothetical protein